MTTDYDTPRIVDAFTDPDTAGSTLASLGRAGSTPATGVGAGDVDDDDEGDDGLELNDFDLYAEDLAVPIVPLRTGEFVCSACFLIQDRHRLSPGPADSTVCLDCT